MDSELFCEVIEGAEAVAGVKALLVLPVAALHLAIVAGCVGTNKLMTNIQLGGSQFKQSWKIPLAVGETVGKFKAVVRLDALHSDAPAGIPSD